MFKALSNRHRLEIFKRLCTCCVPGTRCRGIGNELPCVSELGRDLGIVASTLSHHLKELRNAGLIEMLRNGKNIECRVEPEVLKEIGRFFGGLAAVD